MKRQKKMPISRYGFPMKIKIVRPSAGHPRKVLLRKPEMFQEFCLWSALPTPLRNPKTQREFEEKWGVHKNTVAKWKKRQDYWEMVANARREWSKDKTSDVIHGLYRNASTRGEAAEVKLWLQAVEDWSEKTVAPPANITVIGIQGITQQDLENLKKPAPREVPKWEDAEEIKS